MARSMITLSGADAAPRPEVAEDGGATAALPAPPARRSRRMSAALPIVQRMNVLLRATDSLPRTLFPARVDESGGALPVPVLETGSPARAALSGCAIVMMLAIALLATAAALCGASIPLP